MARQEVFVSAEVEEKAPGFTLPTDRRENRASLDDCTKKGPVTLFFYPGDGAEIGRFEEKGASVQAVLEDLDRAL